MSLDENKRCIRANPLADSIWSLIVSIHWIREDGDLLGESVGSFLNGFISFPSKR